MHALLLASSCQSHLQLLSSVSPQINTLAAVTTIRWHRPTIELKEILLLTQFCNVMYLVDVNVYMQSRLSGWSIKWQEVAMRFVWWN